MLTVLFPLLAVGCSIPDPDPGQSGEESMTCAPVSTTDYALADPTPLGFTGQQIVDLVRGDHAGVLTWAKGGTTELAAPVSVSATSVTFRDMEWADDGSGAEVAEVAALGCDDDVVLAVTVGFTTADGAFAESWPLELLATSADAASAYTELDLDTLGGTYTVTEVDPADYDAVRAFLDLTIDSAGVHGVVDGQAEASDAETASASHFDIATFE